MRTLLAFAVIAMTVACQRTPEQQQADKLRDDARQRGSSIENQADTQANSLQQQADALNNQAKQAGGLTGERFKVRADALSKEAKIVRKQADMQSDAIKEAADARIKTSESR
jgi:sensor domain CHASE-containing protein